LYVFSTTKHGFLPGAGGENQPSLHLQEVMTRSLGSAASSGQIGGYSESLLESDELMFRLDW